jgi:hypothetical protein
MDGAIEPERMEWTMKVLSRVVMWGLLFCFPVGANALEPEKPSDKSIEIGVGLICNSEEQVQRYLSLHVKDEEPETAIQTVNTEAKDPNACSMAAIAFVRGKEGATVPAPGGQTSCSTPQSSKRSTKPEQGGCDVFTQQPGFGRRRTRSAPSMPDRPRRCCGRPRHAASGRGAMAGARRQTDAAERAAALGS